MSNETSATNAEFTPADEFTKQAAESDNNEQVFETEELPEGVNPEDLGYEEISLDELEEEENFIGDKENSAETKLLEDIHNIPIISDKEKYKRIKDIVENGEIDYNSVNSVETMIYILHAVNEVIESRDYYKKYARRLSAKTPDGKELVDVNGLKDSLEAMYNVISEAKNTQSRKVRFEIMNTLNTLTILCRDVLSCYHQYDPNDIEAIVDWMNKLTDFPEYLSIFKDVYFSFVIGYVNSMLKKKKDISKVYIKALGILVKLNSRVLNVILKEKSEMYSPLVKYVKKIKEDNKL